MHQNAGEEKVNFPGHRIMVVHALGVGKASVRFALARLLKIKTMGIEKFPENPPPIISRREFLKLGGMAAAGIALYRYDQLLSNLLGGQYENHIEEATDFLKKTYGLDILIGPPPPSEESNITGTELNKYELSRVLGLVMEEIVKYPPDFFGQEGVSAIRFLRDPKIGGKKYFGGFAQLKGTIGLAYAARPFEMKRGYFRNAFNHELYHILDFKNGGFDEDDDEWLKIHECGCQPYEKIGEKDRINGEAPSPDSWFLGPHGQKNPAEDRAMFGADIMIADSHRDLLQRIKNETDPKTRQILQRKYDLTKSNFSKWSNGAMDGAYWDDLLNGRVKADYFSVKK